MPIAPGNSRFWLQGRSCPTSESTFRQRSFDVLGVNWQTFALSQPAAHTTNQAELFARYVRGAVAPVNTATFPLDRAADAIRRLQDRSAMGKMVVMI